MPDGPIVTIDGKSYFATPVTALNSSGTDIVAGGGAATIADGADVAEGATTNAAVVNPALAGTTIGLLKGLLTELLAIIAKQPSLGTAGTASANVLSVQGIASGTALVTTDAGATRTPTITTPSTGAAIAAGKRYIEFIFSSDFAGTIGGQTFAGTTDSSYNLPLLNGADTYSAVVYTISAGSVRLTTIV